MIRRLRIKLVCVVMSIAMVLLACILGLVIRFNITAARDQSISMLRTIAAAPFQLGSPSEPTQTARLPFFLVQIGPKGEMLAVSGGSFDLSDRALLTRLISDVLRADAETGELAEYDLRYLKTGSAVGQTIVFADMTAEQASIRNMIGSCIVIFLLGSVAFFGLSLLLADRVVRPVEQAWAQQRQFVADASHELKTPLSVIMANAELMQDGSADDQLSCAQNILTMSYQMRTLVENMLEMARVDNGTLHVSFRELDLSQLVRDAALSFHLLYEERGLRLECDISEDISIRGSEQHLFQVLDVLLDNAEKYTFPQSTVRVSLRESGRHCLLTVSDPGEPIGAADLKNIFKRFYRADKARPCNGSYGLGLAIAQGIVQMHGGKIWAESKGGYNSFYVQLPVSQRESGTGHTGR